MSEKSFEQLAMTWAEKNASKAKRKSKLEPYKAAIFLLLEKGFTQKHILEFLEEECDLKCNLYTLQSFVKVRGKQKNLGGGAEPATKETSKSEKKDSSEKGAAGDDEERKKLLEGYIAKYQSEKP